MMKLKKYWLDKTSGVPITRILFKNSFFREE